MNHQYFENLSPEERRIIVDKGTEAPFTGEYDDFYESGIFVCRACGNHLYDSSSKFDAGCGWPAFDKVKDGAIKKTSDFHLGYERTEITCAKCDGHLGHVFVGEKLTPENTRHCVNSISIRFIADEKMNKATFAAGCFWGVEELFRSLNGVYSTDVGYIGGTTKNPTYKEVCYENTNHAEAVEVVYDPTQISYDKLIQIFWENHNPTTLNRQGPDVGTQYRSAVFFHDEEQKEIAIRTKEELDKSAKFKNAVVTEIVPSQTFYRAEEYHQEYLYKRGKGSCGI
ncbi:bifunctional methionine sulfoxide reductase B/A protein [Flavobacteriales bacterium]|jgi:peptide methionine sulfoxide reductase msrA/msrB|nr:bifunctional methionine sulfoxide reductase B/A protein [Flavobacteriales bacterium]